MADTYICKHCERECIQSGDSIVCSLDGALIEGEYYDIDYV